MQLLDGSGTGRRVKVDLNNRLLTKSSMKNEITRISDDDGEAFSWSNATYNYDAADTILLIRNDNSDKHLHIQEIHLHGDTETEAQIHCPTDTSFTPAGTAVAGVNWNRKSGLTAEATAKADETGNTQGDIVWRGRLYADNAKVINFKGGIILGHHDSIGVDYVTVGGEAHVTIVGYYHGDE